MEYINRILFFLAMGWEKVSGLFMQLTSLQGLAMAVVFLAFVPRILLFLSGRLATLFKVPRLIVRVFDGELNPDSKILLVLVSGIRSPRRMLRKCAKIMSQNILESDILRLRIDNALFSNSSPYEVSAQINDLINAQFNKKAKSGSEYEKIVIAAHSFGALFVRKAVLCASASYGIRTPKLANRVIKEDLPWRRKLDRLVFLGGINSGFERLQTWYVHAICVVLELMGISKLLLSLEAGSPFVETLRQEWISLIRKPFESKSPKTIQLVGDDDWIVGRENDIDLDVNNFAPDSAGHYVFEIGGSAHFSILDMSLDDDSELSLDARRARTFLDALTNSKEELGNKSLQSPIGAGITELQRREKVRRFILVYDDAHDMDLWIETLPQAKEKIFADRDDIIVSREQPPRLSRFSFLFNFLGRREAQLRWYNSKITKINAQYPNADLSVIAIKNGTWIASNSILENRQQKIKTLLLVGSILPRQFPWDELVKQGRVDIVCNALAHEDLFTAIIGGFYQFLLNNFPLFARMRCFQLGDSGFRGFNWIGSNMGEISYIAGTSDAFLESRAAIRFATAFGAFGGPAQEANIIATQGYKAIKDDTDPYETHLKDVIHSDFVGDAAKGAKFLNKFAWFAGTAIFLAIIGAVWGSGFLLYTSLPLYSTIAFGIPILLAILILDSL